MAGLGSYALISSLINLVANLLPEVKNTFFALSSSSSAQAPKACAIEADLRRLQRLLERIKATLYDAEERNIQDKSVRLWLKEISELGYKAEYVLEEYMYEVYRTQVEAQNASDLNTIKGDFDVSGVYSVQIPYSIVNRIRDIKSRFEEIENDRKALCLREEDAPRRKKIRNTAPVTSHLVAEKSLFGREEEKEKIINSLLLEGEVISVLPVVGKGGIGKTTVAQLVYNDKRVQNSFDLKGWVCVSYDFNIERIGEHIMQSFTGEACKLDSLSVLLEKIKNEVSGKRAFLVLDDVWSEESSPWESLCMSLMQATKVAILVTTRNISVSRIMQTMEPLQLAYLSYDKCWLLFTHYAFQGTSPANQDELEKIGKKIVAKCSGLPLAVKSIASLLSYGKVPQSWVEILQSDLWESDVGTEVLAPLQISYERLPPNLKPCLVLCSMCPKNHKYRMNFMNRLWIAHGYIQSNGRRTIEEVAADYTQELYERSFFDDYNIGWDCDNLSFDATFRLHDLALLNSEKTCCSIEDGKQTFISKEVCHLVLYGELIRGLPELLSSNKIPFFQTFIRLCSADEKRINLNSLSKAEHLRALDLGDAGDYTSPFLLGNMKHLRYLSVSSQIIAPQSIFSCYSLRILILYELGKYHMELDAVGNLINLEFLKLNFARKKSVQLPESVGLLKKLRVLEIHGNTIHGKFEIPECIENLVELHRIVIMGTTLEELPDSICRLRNLKELIIQSSLKALPKDFGNLTNLRILFLGESDYFYFLLRRENLIPPCIINMCSLRMPPNNCRGAIGWLKEFNNPKGALIISDIRNITSIEDAKNANLISMRNLDTMILICDRNLREMIDTKQFICSTWGVRHDLNFVRDYVSKNSVLEISIGFGYSNRRLMGDEWDHDILENFQSHPNLKNLKINHYPGWDHDILENFQPHPNHKNLKIANYSGWEFPRWMGDPLSCSSLVKLWIESCRNISSLHLGSVLSLRYVYIFYCGELLHLKRESLPSQLKDLTVVSCRSLLEVALLESLSVLELSHCYMLKSLTTLQQKMLETASESSSILSMFIHRAKSASASRGLQSLHLRLRKPQKLVL